MEAEGEMKTDNWKLNIRIYKCVPKYITWDHYGLRYNTNSDIFFQIPGELSDIHLKTLIYNTYQLWTLCSSNIITENADMIYRGHASSPASICEVINTASTKIMT